MFLSHGNVIKNAVLQRFRVVSSTSPLLQPVAFSRFESSSAPARMEEHGFESTTISDILKAKGKSADGSWLWCTTNDSVYDAVQSVCMLIRSLLQLLLEFRIYGGWCLLN